jgi:plastocyanin
MSPLPGESAVPPAVAEVTVSIADMLYQPATLEVPAGTTVRWTNDDRVVHTVTARDGSFNSGVLAIGAEFSQTFDEVGTFDYFCAVHPLQTGRIVVTAPDPDSPASVEGPAASGAAAAGDAVPAADTQTAETSVSIIDLAFEPATLEVPAGATVRWSNHDSVGHTVTAVDGAYESGLLTVGAEFGRTFDEPGTFEYFCAIHPEMRGRVIVATPAIEGG